MWNGCFSGPTGNFGNGHENRACYCEINIRDVFREPASPLSRLNETHLFPRASAFFRLKETRAFNLRLLYLDEQARSWGPPVRTGNRLLHCPLHFWHVCNVHSEWSPSLIDQDLWQALINVCYRYVGHPYSNCPLLPAASWNQLGFGSHQGLHPTIL
jgi:hypothetical protein